MAQIEKAQVEQVLRTFLDPYLDKDWLFLGWVKDLQVTAEAVSIAIQLGYPAAGIAESLQQQLAEQVKAATGASSVDVAITWDIPVNKSQDSVWSLSGVKNIVCVSSGKGGVGKSTTAVNLALALQADGAKVGLLDADIYGPSQPIMLGVPTQIKPEVVNQQGWKPVPAFGLQTMSIGYLVTEETPLVWRGPMASKYFQQLVQQTIWQELDYLVIDMPPGTGDIQLTLAQSVPVAGAVIVTTPQDIALLDAQKGVEMFKKVSVPVLGVVENMAVHICSECGHQEHLFGQGGGERIAKDYKVPQLGALPLALQIRSDVDDGYPTVVKDPEGEIAQIYREIGRKAAAQLAAKSAVEAQAFPNIVVNND